MEALQTTSQTFKYELIVLILHLAVHNIGMVKTIELSFIIFPTW